MGFGQRLAYTAVEENEVKNPEKKTITIEYECRARGCDETHVLSLTPEQYRLMEWLSDNEFLSDSIYWYVGKPEVEIKEI